jgi:hypothetical protein
MQDALPPNYELVLFYTPYGCLVGFREEDPEAPGGSRYRICLSALNGWDLAMADVHIVDGHGVRRRGLGETNFWKMVNSHLNDPIMRRVLDLGAPPVEPQEDGLPWLTHWCTLPASPAEEPSPGVPAVMATNGIKHVM